MSAEEVLKYGRTNETTHADERPKLQKTMKKRSVVIVPIEVKKRPCHINLNFLRVCSAFMFLHVDNLHIVISHLTSRFT
jgi:hypothetical protein